MKRMLALCSLMSVAAAAVLAAPVPTHLMPRDEPLCYPLRVGDKSVHQLPNGEVTFTVSKVEKVANAHRVTLDVADGPTNSNTTQVSLVSARGVELVEYGGRPVEPSVWWLKLPHAEKNTWTSVWTPTGMKFEFATKGWEIVEVPAGRFRAIKVERTEIQNDMNLGTTTYWYAPRYGCIKITGRSPTRVMKTFTPGK